MDNFIIRRYEKSDYKQVVELHKLALQGIGAYISGDWDKDLNDIEKNYLERFSG